MLSILLDTYIVTFWNRVVEDKKSGKHVRKNYVYLNFKSVDAATNKEIVSFGEIVTHRLRDAFVETLNVLCSYSKVIVIIKLQKTSIDLCTLSSVEQIFTLVDKK